MLHINDIVFRYGGRALFNGGTLHVPEGQHIGLIGRNGSGKSTLFKLIRGELSLDDGSISVRPRASLGWVKQDAPEGEITPHQFVLAADQERTKLLAQLESEGDSHHIAEIHERLEVIGASSAPARAAEILAGLGFNEEMQQRPLASFSGGWRVRVSLAAVLFSEPDILLLDEPTNHLDLESSLWLEGFLARYPGTLVLISHDRDLLNKVVERIVHIDNGRLQAYGGNYNKFEKTRQERIELQAKEVGKQLEQRRRIQAFIDRFKAKATKAAQAQSRVKLLEKMGPVTPIVEDKPVSFDFPDPDPLSSPLITLDEVTCGYDPEKPVLSKLSLRVDMDDRIAIIGPNGNGKSTLAKLLAVKLAPFSGKLGKSAKLKVGYFAQHQTEELDVKSTPFEHMQKLMPMATEAKIRAQLGRFGFEAERGDMKIANLSGGEKARLLFALVTRDAPHLLILDEPTNHLDIDSRAALLQALNAYEGAVIIITHDAHLIEAAADRLWLVDSGTVKPFDGDVEAYRNWLLESRRPPKGKSGAGLNVRKEERKNSAAVRAKLAPLKKEIGKLEAELDKLAEKKRDIEAELARPELYNGPPAKLLDLQKQLATLDARIGEVEGLWIVKQEELEEMNQA